MWHEPAHRLALLELQETGKLQRRSAQSLAWSELLTLGWACRTSRHNELAIVPMFRSRVEEVLDGCWPEWRTIQAALHERSLPPTEAGLNTLRSQQRLASAGELPRRLNQKTAAAVLGEHSKAQLGKSARSVLQECTVTSDYLVRLRGCQGLTLMRDGATHDAATLEQLQGELIFSERALLDGTTLEGAPAALLLVENVGIFVDLVPMPGWLIAHIPGWNTQAAKRLFDLFPNIPAFHFGDFDPDGLEIYRHLQQARPSLRWIVFDWFADYLPSHRLMKSWPDEEELAELPPLIQRLTQEHCWLEQEVLVFDERLWPMLQSLLSQNQHTTWGS